VQSTAENFSDFSRKSDLRGSVGSFFSDLDESEGDDDDLEGSGC
jgi:hypothetical protein